MELTKTSTLVGILILLCSFLPRAQAAAHSSTALTPAPAPGPDHVNISSLLMVAGPFHTFLQYLQQTKVIETFQNQANKTDEGITIFVPKDVAFKSLKKPSLSNLTADQLKQLCLFHSLPHYYSFSDFRNLSQSGPVPTFAGGQYTLNFTDVAGTIHLSSGWTNTKVSSSVFSTNPIALYQIDRVLLPEAIFGTDIPPTPSPVPAPDVSPAADSPAETSNIGASPESAPSDSSSETISYFGKGNVLALAVTGVLVVVM